MGAALGAAAARDEDAGFGFGLRTGLGLLPHAGMAIALVAFVVEQAPVLGDGVSAVVLGSIVVFELAGPLILRRVLSDVGEAGKAGRKERKLPSLDTTRAFGKVLVPVGSVEIVLPRLAFIFDIVGNLGAELVAVHVSRPGSGGGQNSQPEILRLIRRAAEERDVPCITVHRVSERIAATLVRVSQDHEVDLIIMGEPARASLLEPSRWGLVAQRVVRDVDVPVLVYPVDPSHPGAVPSAYLRRGLRAQADDAGSGTLPAREPLEDAVPVSTKQVPESDDSGRPPADLPAPGEDGPGEDGPGSAGPGTAPGDDAPGGDASEPGGERTASRRG
jgi:nucleotide-binding universal stress UspA family protein